MRVPLGEREFAKRRRARARKRAYAARACDKRYEECPHIAARYLLVFERFREFLRAREARGGRTGKERFGIRRGVRYRVRRNPARCGKYHDTRTERREEERRTRREEEEVRVRRRFLKRLEERVLRLVRVRVCRKYEELVRVASSHGLVCRPRRKFSRFVHPKSSIGNRHEIRISALQSKRVSQSIRTRFQSLSPCPLYAVCVVERFLLQTF